MKAIFHILAAFLFSPSPALAGYPAQSLPAAERAFAHGVELRHDAERAPEFAAAAEIYDMLWANRYRTPELALNRARAHRLAGNLPRSIAALHDGLAAARFSRPLQVELDDVRSRVVFPLEGELAEQGRPRPVRTVSTRMSPADAWYAAGFLWLLACGGVARFAMTRAAVWLVFTALCVVALGVLGALWLQDAHLRERDESLPLLVVTNDIPLRKGNATVYPANRTGVAERRRGSRIGTPRRLGSSTTSRRRHRLAPGIFHHPVRIVTSSCLSKLRSSTSTAHSPIASVQLRRARTTFATATACRRYRKPRCGDTSVTASRTSWPISCRALR